MLEPEYRIGLWVLTREIGVWCALRAVVPGALKSLVGKHGLDKDLDDTERHKRELKNRFRLLVLIYSKGSHIFARYSGVRGVRCGEFLPRDNPR
jgi:hypothetical protein